MFKKALYISLLSLSIALFSATISSAQSLVGSWLSMEKVETRDRIGYVHIDSSGYAYFVNGRDTVGGKDFVAEGYRGTMKYAFDSTKSPKTIDFILILTHDKSGKEVNIERARIQGIYEFLEPNKIRMKITFKQFYRPYSFDIINESEHLLLLEKID